MSVTEAKMWRKVKTSTAMLGLAFRVENTAGTSIPDVFFLGPPNRFYAIELKTRATRKEVRFNKYQVAWWRAYNGLGLKCPGLIVVSDKRDLSMIAYDSLILQEEVDFRYLSGGKIMVPTPPEMSLGFVNSEAQWETLMEKYD